MMTEQIMVLSKTAKYTVKEEIREKDNRLDKRWMNKTYSRIKSMLTRCVFNQKPKNRLLPFVSFDLANNGQFSIWLFYAQRWISQKSWYFTWKKIEMVLKRPKDLAFLMSCDRKFHCRGRAATERKAHRLRLSYSYFGKGN